MNYQRIYDELVVRAQARTLDKGEWHHIVPRSMGGSDDESNLVHFTYREHFIAHMLLYKIHKNAQMAFALNRMSNFGLERNISSRTYKIAREIHRRTAREWTRKRMRGKTVFMNIETGQQCLMKCDEVDTTIWKGINYGRKMQKSEKFKGKTVYKDSNGNNYCLKIDDPKIKELGLKGVGDTTNATKVAAEKMKSKVWYYKLDSEFQNEIILLVPSLYAWFLTTYDEEKPKATGVKRWMRYNNISIKTKMFGRFFDEFKNGWAPDEKFYEVYNEIIKNRKI